MVAVFGAGACCVSFLLLVLLVLIVLVVLVLLRVGGVDVCAICVGVASPYSSSKTRYRWCWC